MDSSLQTYVALVKYRMYDDSGQVTLRVTVAPSDFLFGHGYYMSGGYR